MFGLIKSHFPNARIEFVHSPLFSLVLFCRPTHHGKKPKEVFNRMGHICRLQEIFLNSLRGRMGVLNLSLYTAIRPIQVRGMVWFRLFLFAVLPRIWWEISLPNFSLMNLGPENSWHKSDNLLVNITKLWPLHLPRSVLSTF